MKRYFTIIAAVVAIYSVANAQEGGYNESVVVRGSYRPTIEQAEKLNFPAVITDTMGRMEHTFQYSITPVRLKAIYEPSRIKAARIVGEPTTKLYNNYMRLGFGNYWTPLADLYWSSTRDRMKTYGIRANHLSSWGSLPDYGPNHFGQTGVTLFGKYIVGDALQLSSDLGYEHDHNLYYGFTDSTLQAVLGVPCDSISTADYRASYNLATWNIGLSNMQLDPNKFGYAANLHLSDLWATYGRNQFNLTLSGDVRYGFELANRYRGVAYLHAEWEGYADRFAPEGDLPLGYGWVASPVPPAGYINLVSAPTDTMRWHRNIVKVNPYADFMLSGLQFHTGLTAAWDAFTDDTATAFRLFPDVVVSKSLLGNNLSLSLGATGCLDANNWNTMRIVNPYIAPDAEQRATTHYDFSLHARWTLSKKLEANAEASYSIIDNLCTYQPDRRYGLENVFSPLYMSANLLTVGGDLAFVNDEMLTLRAGGHYYHYSSIAGPADPVGMPTAYTDVPYRPDWDALLRADVNYHDQWLFHLEGQLIGKVFDGVDEMLPMRYGIAAEVEYRHNRALSFFLRMDNLAFQRYYLWRHYPSQRGLFILGLTYTIPHK